MRPLHVLRRLRTYPLQRVALPPYLLLIGLLAPVCAAAVDGAVLGLVLVGEELRGVGWLDRERN